MCDVVTDRSAFVAIAQTPDIPTEKVKSTTVTHHNRSLNTGVLQVARATDRRPDQRETGQPLTDIELNTELRGTTTRHAGRGTDYRLTPSNY